MDDYHIIVKYIGWETSLNNDKRNFLIWVLTLSSIGEIFRIPSKMMSLRNMRKRCRQTIRSISWYETRGDIKDDKICISNDQYIINTINVGFRSKKGNHHVSTWRKHVTIKIVIFDLLQKTSDIQQIQVTSYFTMFLKELNGMNAERVLD